MFPGMRFRPALDRILGTNMGAKVLRDLHVARMRRETNEPTRLLFRHSAGASVRGVMFRHNRMRKA